MEQNEMLGDVKFNGLEMIASSYEAVLTKERDPETQKSIETQIKALKIAARLTEEEQLALFSTGIYNDLCRDYLKVAMKRAGAGENLVDTALDELHFLFDMGSVERIRREAGGE